MDNKLVLFILIIIAIAAIVTVLKKKSSKKDQPETWPYYPKKPLSQPEQSLFFKLKKTLPEHVILAQVGLSQLLGVKKGENFGQWFNKINRMTADFVICSKNFEIIAVIELDDSTHNRQSRKEADRKKDKALTDAGIKIIRWNVSSLPNQETIENITMKL